MTTGVDDMAFARGGEEERERERGEVDKDAREWRAFTRGVLMLRSFCPPLPGDVSHA